MNAELRRRRSGKKKPGVEALGHAERRDPVRIGYEFIECKNKVIFGEHFQEGGPALRQGAAVDGLDRSGALRVNESARSANTRKQDSAFLERLADRGDPEAQLAFVQSLAARTKLTMRDDLVIARIDAAARKHQRARGKIDLIMAHHHECLDFTAILLAGGGSIAQQKDAGCRPRRDYFSHYSTPRRHPQGASFDGSRDEASVSVMVRDAQFCCVPPYAGTC